MESAATELRCDTCLELFKKATSGVVVQGWPPGLKLECRLVEVSKSCTPAWLRGPMRWAWGAALAAAVDLGLEDVDCQDLRDAEFRAAFDLRKGLLDESHREALFRIF